MPATLVKYTLNDGEWDIDTEDLTLKKPVVHTPPVLIPHHYCNPLADSWENSMDSGVDVYDKKQPLTAMAAVRQFEEQLADRFICYHNYQEAKQLQSQIHEGGYYGMVCADYIPVGLGPNDNLGWWMYGTLKAFPEVLVKVYLPPSHVEMELLNMTTNEVIVLACIEDLKWEIYGKAGEHAMGYVIAKARSIKELTTAI